MNALAGIIFDWPWLLVAAVLMPIAVWWLRVRVARSRKERLARFADGGTLPRLLPFSGQGAGARTVRLVLVMVLAGVALAGPRWGVARGPTTSRGIDMAIALDASLSMTAPDERPSRLERMKQEVRRLRSMSRADRVALIAFAGRSYILTPLTTDDGAIELFLDNLDPSVVGQAGSSIARAIRQGTDLLLASDGSADRALVIMTDGEVFESTEDVEAAAREASSQGVTIVTVGFGTVEGSTIPIRDGSVIKEKKDDQGNVVITKYNPEVLQRTAEAGGGTFIAADASDKATRVRAALRTLRSARRTVDAREDTVPRFLWVLIPALLLLMYDTWIMSRRRPSQRVMLAGPATPSAASSAMVMLFLVVGLSVSCARPPDPAAMFKDGDVMGAIRAYRSMIAAGDTTAVTRYNLGTVLLAADSLAESIELLEAVRRSTDGEVRMRARYNAGLAQLLMGRMEGNPDSERALAAARSSYRALLQDRPADSDAQWNYELALRDPPPNSGGGGGGGGENESQEEPQPSSSQSLDQRQAEALLNSAAREERDVQGRKQRQGKIPPVGKDW